MMKNEILKEEYRRKPENEKELFKHFIKFGKTLEVSSLSPQALFVLYLSSK